MKRIGIIITAILLVVSMTACSGGSKNIQVLSSNWYVINESYLDPAVQVRFQVQNAGSDTIQSYTLGIELLDDSGRHLTSFESESTHSLLPGETKSGNLHLEPSGIDVTEVGEVNVSVISEVVK